jgi:hypothetical protein
MVQKKIDFLKFTRSSGTTQVLMFWASLGLHFLVGSNLGWFGRLEPVKFKPVGGDVNVVSLTPAEQSRVPEAVKSKPLSIVPTPVNPQSVTRISSSSSPPRNSGGASNFVPPRSQSQLPLQPSNNPTPTVRQPTQPPIVPAPPNNPTSNRSGKQPRSSDSGDNIDTNSRSGGRPPRKTVEEPSQSDNPVIAKNPLNPPNSPSPIPSPTNSPDTENLSSDFASIQKRLNQEVQRLKSSIANSEEKNAELPTKQDYPSGIKSCVGNRKNGYILFAVLRKKEDLTNDSLQITIPQISSFLGKQGENLAGQKISQALTYISDQKSDLGKNVIYRFRFEYQAFSCQA